jgi:hypothetical protein
LEETMRTSTSVLASLLLVGGCSTAADLPLGGPYRALEGSDAGGSGSASFVAEDSGVGGDTGSVVLVGTGPGSSGTGSGTGVVVTSGTGSGTGTVMMSGPGSGTGSSAGSGPGTGTGTGTGTGSGSGPPTWTYLYDTYLTDATTTIGDCDGSCHHHSECSSASACYSWIGGGQKGALSNGGGLFTWDQGYMPTHGTTSDPAAEADFAAWIAAGSQDN